MLDLRAKIHRGSGSLPPRIAATASAGRKQISRYVTSVKPATWGVITVRACNSTGSVTIGGSGSTDSDGTIVRYDWDLDNDGSFDDATGETPSIAFASLPLAVRDNGTYTIGVRADG